MNWLPDLLRLLIVALAPWLAANHGTADAEVAAESGGWIDVTSLDRKGEAMDPSQVDVSVVSHFGVPVHAQARPDQAGGFTRIGPLPPSTYRVQREVRSLDELGHVVLFEDVTVLAGEGQRVILDESAVHPEELKTRCKGWVSFETKPLQGVLVTIRDELGVVARAITDEEGQYDLAMAKAGSMWLKATHAQTNSAVAKEVVIRPDKRTWFPLHLRRQGSHPQQWPQDGFAAIVQSAGDLDGDGAGDLLITENTIDPLEWYRRSCVAVSGATGQCLYEVPASRFRRSCRGVGEVGDVNGDGTPDFVTTFRAKPGAPPPDEQGIQLRSGKDGRLLLERVLEARGKARERDVTARRIHDVDGDGLGDIALARREFVDGTTKLVSIELLGGRDLEPIQRIPVDLFEYRWTDWCCPGDLDLDGIEDIVVQGRRRLGEEPCLLGISGSTQRPIPGWEDRMTGHGTWGPLPAGDLDGDGAGDLFVARTKSLGSRKVAVTLLALSGRTGEVLAQHVRTQQGVDGVTLVPLPDLDGDGAMDLLLASHGGNPFFDVAGRMSVHSGSDLSLIQLLAVRPGDPMLFDHLGIHGCSMADVNGDGTSDFALGATNPFGASLGRVEIFSGKDGQPLRVITRNSIQDEPASEKR